MAIQKKENSRNAFVETKTHHLNREFKNTKAFGKEIISDAAKFESSKGDYVKSYVEIHIEKTDYKGEVTEYKLRRSFSTKNMGDNQWSDDVRRRG